MRPNVLKYMIVQYDTFDLCKSDTIQYDKIVYKATKGYATCYSIIWYNKTQEIMI